MKIRRIVLTLIIIGLACLAYVIWSMCLSDTKVAFVNYQSITLGQISKAAKDVDVKLAMVDPEDFDNLDDYNFVMINGMGLRITEEQRGILLEKVKKGLPVLTTMATNPDNDIVSLDSISEKTIKKYLSAGGRANYRNMLVYIRRNIDGKTIGTSAPDAPVMRQYGQFYHIDPANPDDEDLEFFSLADYENFLKNNNLYRDKAPRIIVTGVMGDAGSLVDSLEKTGNVVYPVRDFKAAVRGRQVDTISPSAVINMAHGRLGDFAVDYLKKANIPLFSPLNVNSLVSEWESDKMGMVGGFMSQSVVMPEIDGAIRPFALFGHYLGDDGLENLSAIHGRLSEFVNTVNRHIALKTKPVKDKKLVIYYYKGPGNTSLTASGMEVVPSLFNLLKALKNAGYTVNNLPQTSEELGKLLQQQGSVYNAYATGAKAKFLAEGKPQLISADEYNDWTSKALKPDLVADIEAVDGAFPGSYISTENGELAIPHIDFGNVVLMPQLAAGVGSDDFAIVHGTDAAPPHAYVAEYLWARYGFGADAIMHFGTHGSLEFTPRKQVALSNNDWSDRLVGDIPHIYFYSIGNVGEAIIAKRRSYATLVSYLTPPFIESNVSGIYKNLTEAIRDYNDKPADASSLKVKKLTVKLGIHRELRLDSNLNVPYTEKEISRISSFAEELASEKVTGKLYTLGETYSDSEIRTMSKSLKDSARAEYENNLRISPSREIASILNALNGGYIEPSPGGDALANPNSVPSGRNMYSVNPEATPSEDAWREGVKLAQNTIDMYRERHNDSIPRKVSYTLWSGEFVETQGATIAQIFYMLGVEPIRDFFGRVTDVRLIPSEKLGRPRIDVVVQTSGQLRDLAASRLFLITRAVEMAAKADDKYENYVAQGVVDAEKVLVEKGLSPKDARHASTYRVFGGLNGGYGTGITGMVQSGDAWDDKKDIAEVYMNNMGAFYGTQEEWENVQKLAFEAALTNTDAVIQPRQSNTWGALSLDHVYEFMGGLNLAVKTVTGKEPDAYFSDYRNHNKMRMQELKEAIGVESRTTIFNPAYIQEKMKGEASSAAGFSEIVQNIYGWDVMRDEAIDQETWNEVYDVYVKDKFNLGTRNFFESKSPAALQEMTASMLEAARRDMWHASSEQINTLAKLHTELVEKYSPACSESVCNNSRLRQFLTSHLDKSAAEKYNQSIREVRQAAAGGDKSVVMKKDETNTDSQKEMILNGVIIGAIFIAIAVGLIFVVRRRRKDREE